MGISSHAVDQSVTVLVVEDSELALYLYDTALAASGSVRLLKARNGFEGLVAIAEHKPDVVITDLNMPAFDGFKMLDILDKDDSHWPGLMLVVSGVEDWQIERAGGLPTRSSLIRKKGVTAESIGDVVKQFIRNRTKGTKAV